MKCILIEDELPAQRILKNYLSKLPDVELLGCFQSALTANSLLQQQHVDVIFLDINLPDISGIQYVKTLQNPPKIIMTTAYHEHAVESFELDTICDYLVKPFSFERFLKAINKVKSTLITNQTPLHQKENTSNSVFLNIDKTLHKIQLTDILYIESDKNYVTLVTKKAKLCYLDSLKNWMHKLPTADFIQVHKSYIINYHQIEKISGNLLYIDTNKIPIGRMYKTALLKLLHLSKN